MMISVEAKHCISGLDPLTKPGECALALAIKDALKAHGVQARVAVDFQEAVILLEPSGPLTRFPLIQELKNFQAHALFGSIKPIRFVIPEIRGVDENAPLDLAGTA